MAFIIYMTYLFQFSVLIMFVVIPFAATTIAATRDGYTSTQSSFRYYRTKDAQR